MANVPNLVVQVKFEFDAEELRQALTKAWEMGVRRGFYSQPLFTLEQAMEDCPIDNLNFGEEE